MFIEVSYLGSGEKVYINPDQIILITKYGTEGTEIMTVKDFITVKESYSVVKERIESAYLRV